ncbi:MAG: hypothetical protein JW722_05365 [Demequinaceae bacterium]|nr:hypothetical protein [Demequinaceae bacterium]
MSKKQLVALIGVVVMLIGLFLPFAKAFFISISLWDGDDGKLVLGVVVLAAVGIVLRWNTFVVIISLLGGSISVMDMVDSSDKGFDLGIGGYVIIAGAVLTSIAAIAAMGDKRKASRMTAEDNLPD